MSDSDNLQPPFFGPTWPIYPQLDQLIEVTGAALAGTEPAIYPAILIQIDPDTLESRQRVPCYAVEPNGVPLGEFIYDSRLVGAYPPETPGGIPLFAVTCCVPVTPSSSSSSSHSH